MAYYGPRFQPTASRSFWDQASDVLGGAGRGYTLGLALKEEEAAKAEAKRQQQRREGFEDWERGIVPEGEDAAPRATERYPETEVPSNTLGALDRWRGMGQPPISGLPAETPDEGFMVSGPPIRDEGFERRAKPVQDGGFGISQFLDEGQQLESVQPRRYPGMDPYTVGGRTYDPEVPLQRGLSTKRAELTLADELDEARAGRTSDREQAQAQQQFEREVANLVAGGVPEGRARAIAGNKGAVERELYPSQFRTNWPTSAAERRPVPSFDAALNSIYKLYGTFDPETNGWTFPGADPTKMSGWLHAAARALQNDQPIPDMPQLPMDAIEQEPEQKDGWWKRLGQSIIPGGKPGFWPDRGGHQVEGPTEGAGGDAAAGVGRGPARAAPAAGGNVFNTQSRAMLADEWERLVEQGMTPAEATAEVERRYNLQAQR